MNFRGPSRPAFTLLEALLAAAIGSMVALAALGLFMTINRTDSMLAARYRQTASLERAHRVLSRAFLSLVTSDKAPPRPPRTTTGTTPGTAGGKAPTTPASTAATTTAGSTAAGTGATASGAPASALAATDQSAAPEPPPPPPRLRLTVDQAMNGQRMIRPGTQGNSADPVQIFEVVVHTSPVGPMVSDRPTSGTEDSREPETRNDSRDTKVADRKEPPRLLSPTGKVFRGAFVLRPTADSQGENPRDDAQRSWSLWWQPLPPAREDGQQSAAVTPNTAQAVELTQGISYFRWKVFDDRERKTEYSAVWRTELPAYVEVELATTAGLWANWMFEVDWVDGSESATDTTDDETTAATPPATTTTTTTKIVPVK